LCSTTAGVESVNEMCVWVTVTEDAEAEKDVPDDSFTVPSNITGEYYSG